MACDSRQTVDVASLQAEIARLRGICHQRGERLTRRAAQIDAAYSVIRRHRSGAHHIGDVHRDYWEWPDGHQAPVTDEEQAAIRAAEASR